MGRDGAGALRLRLPERKQGAGRDEGAVGVERGPEPLRPSPRPQAPCRPGGPAAQGGAMNLASQSGEAGSGQLLFANFNQDNT